GINSRAKQQGVKKFIQKLNLDCCVILENKLDKDKMVKVKNYFMPQSWCYLDNFEFHDNGRIIICWNPVKASIKKVNANAQVLNVRVCTGSMSFLLSAIYGWHNTKDREPLWTSHLDCFMHCKDPWLIGGDFNCLAHMSDKINGQKVLPKDTTELESFFETTNFFDHVYSALHYTWSDRHSVSPIFCKLDTIIVNHVD
uniref:Endonuclease/exonuclease/phosphatase domain-containing protein n=1 Tax=Kalanchoe fedtschenkoi TaxID=63787 RepID=A0A7N0TNZ5_KALFE